MIWRLVERNLQVYWCSYYHGQTAPFGVFCYNLQPLLWSTVKPDPPVNVRVKALPGKKLQVQWDPPPTWPDPLTFPLKYTVQFQWGHANTASNVSHCDMKCFTLLYTVYITYYCYPSFMHTIQPMFTDSTV